MRRGIVIADLFLYPWFIAKKGLPIALASVLGVGLLVLVFIGMVKFCILLGASKDSAGGWAILGLSIFVVTCVVGYFSATEPGSQSYSDYKESVLK